jgi:hypothetical protein
MMDFSGLFLGFLQPVAFGSGAVFVLLAVIRLRTPQRSQVSFSRKSSR